MAIYETSIDIEVHYDYYPFSKGSFEKGGRQLDPDEPASVEVYEVIFRSKDHKEIGIIDLPESDILKLEEEILAEINREVD